jgi:hypothetical protein
MNLQVGRGQVDIHIVLKDLLKEALSLPQFHLLGCVHSWDPLSMFGLRWHREQQNISVRNSGQTGLQDQHSPKLQETM